MPLTPRDQPAGFSGRASRGRRTTTSPVEVLASIRRPAAGLVGTVTVASPVDVEVRTS
jgi:hypothetical protein